MTTQTKIDQARVNQYAVATAQWATYATISFFIGMIVALTTAQWGWLAFGIAGMTLGKRWNKILAVAAIVLTYHWGFGWTSVLVAVFPTVALWIAKSNLTLYTQAKKRLAANENR